MDDFYTNYVVRQYNATFKKNIILACPCYKQYNDFVDFVFKRRNSYFCCIVVVTSDGVSSRVVHNSFPIMLGSEVDFTIRSFEKVDCNVYGSFIIKGDFKLLPNFITNNLGTGHVYKSPKSGGNKRVAAGPSQPQQPTPPTAHTPTLPSKIYIVNLKRDGVGVQVKYDPHSDKPLDVTVFDDLYVANEAVKRKMDRDESMNEDVGRTASGRKRRRIDRSSYVEDLDDRSARVEWIEVMNRVSPVPDHVFTETEYVEYFKACLRCAPELDHLANKTTISPPTLLDRALTHLVRLCEVTSFDAKADRVVVRGDKKRLAALPNKIKSVFSSGNMFFALSNKFTASVMREYKCAYQNVDGQKLHLISKMTSMVKRYVSDQARNSKALKFPVDAFGFIDPVNAREMKGAGETVYLSQLVVTSPESDANSVRRVIEKLASDDVGDELNVVWNGFLTNFKLRLAKVGQLKLRCPFVSVMVYDNYLNVNTKGHVLMKYSSKYRTFVTPHEVMHLFHDAFDRYSMHLNFSSMAMMLPRSVVKAQPAKIVVAMSNIKGRCQTLNSKLSIMSFLYTIGTGNAALIHSVEDGDELISTTFGGYGGGDDARNDIIGGDGGYSKPIVVPVNLVDPQYRYAKLAENRNTGLGDMPAQLKELFAEYRPRSDRSELDGLAYADIVDDCDAVFATINKIYDTWLDNRYMLYVPCPKFERYEPEEGTVPLSLGYYNKITHWRPPRRPRPQHGHRRRHEVCCTQWPVVEGDENCWGDEENDEEQSRSDGLDEEMAMLARAAPVEVNRGVPVRIASCDKLLASYSEYLELDKRTRAPSHILLYTAFGDVFGGCNEDGVILDSGFVEKGPMKLVSITLSVKFTEKINVNKKDSNINDEYCKVTYNAINRTFSPYVVVGILLSRQQLIVRKSKNVAVIESILNAHYRYLIVYKEHSEYIKSVESFYCYDNSTVTVHLRYTIRLGVGCKLANVHGQKGICSTVTDLSVSSVRDLSTAMVGYRADGVQVHPQILFSTTSIVGRTVSSQVYEMLCNNTVAFTEYGEPIALMAYNIHHIESSVKAKVCVTKNDLMTSENGFHANMLTNTSQCLADQGPVGNKNLFHLIAQLNILNGVRLQFLDFDADLLDFTADDDCATTTDDDGENEVGDDNDEEKEDRDEGESSLDCDEGTSSLDRDEGESTLDHDEGESSQERDEGESGRGSQ